MRWVGLVSLAATSLLACRHPPTSDDESQGDSGSGESESGEAESGEAESGEAESDEAESGDTASDETDTGPPDPETVTVSHQFEPIPLDPFEERQPCISWTIDNEEALYVQAVTLANTGGFHHSNGFVVPDDLYDGPDGVWNCSSRGFDTIEASIAGTVLFAQSTQSWVEEQRLNPGAVIKIPPHHRVVAQVHMLNLAPSPIDASLRISLELLHPKDVEAVLTPFVFQYLDLQIPPQSEARFVAECDQFMHVASPNRAPYKVHWLLPHYHYLGNYFGVEVIGGPLDGSVLHEIEGFAAEPVGKRFDPPIDIASGDGVRLTCGFDNWTDQLVQWGNGDGEMCIAFGFAEADLVGQASALTGQAVGEIDGVPHFEGGCTSLVVPKAEGQSPPTEAEIDGELYVPPVDPDDRGLPPVPPCEDTPPDAVASHEPTLAAVAGNVFVPACSFSSCHGSGGGAGGLNFEGDLIADLVDHPATGNTDLPLIAPGDPEGSWLYQRLSRCAPVDQDGNPVAHMPLNAPFLLEPGLVATTRDWIAAGAPG